MAKGYGDLLRETLAEKRGSIEGIQKQLAERQGQQNSWTQRVDLAPMASFVDSMTGANTAQAYQGPTPFEKNQAVIQKLQGALGEQENDYASQLMSAMRNDAYQQQVDAQTNNAQEDRDFDRWYKGQILKNRNRALDARLSGGTGGYPLTKGQEVVDKKFGETYEEQFLTGQITSAEKSLNQLKQVSKKLGVNDELTGGMVGVQPDWYRKRFNQESFDAQQQVEDVVQQSLKAILGAQFTEKEAERLISRAYDPALDEDINKDRVDRLYMALDKALKSKQAAGRYFEENGTMRGFKGSEITTTDDLIAEMDMTPGTVRVLDPQTGEVVEIPQEDLSAAIADGAREVK